MEDVGGWKSACFFDTTCELPVPYFPSQLIPKVSIPKSKQTFVHWDQEEINWEDWFKNIESVYRVGWSENALDDNFPLLGFRPRELNKNLGSRVSI